MVPVTSDTLPPWGTSERNSSLPILNDHFTEILGFPVKRESGLKSQHLEHTDIR